MFFIMKVNNKFSTIKFTFMVNALMTFKKEEIVSFLKKVRK